MIVACDLSNQTELDFVCKLFDTNSLPKWEFKINATAINSITFQILHAANYIKNNQSATNSNNLHRTLPAPHYLYLSIIPLFVCLYNNHFM